MTLAELRERGLEIRTVLESLRSAHQGQPLYFPFFFYGGETLRPMQPYLNKLPAEFVAVIPQLSEAATTARATTGHAAPVGGSKEAARLGAPYREAFVGGLAVRDPFSVDPAIVERGLRGHADTQNELARTLRELGIEPRSPRPDEPNFDIAWEKGGRLYVAEIKSTTPLNAEKQLRLGLGQVLRYRQLLGRTVDSEVVGVLVSEKAEDPGWMELCNSLGVIFVTGVRIADVLTNL